MIQISKLNKTELISKEEVLNQKANYSIEEKNNLYYVSLKEDLKKIDFADKLYKDVKEGSKRWWVLEQRKFDYENFNSKNNHKQMKKTDIDNIISIWDKKVQDFYQMEEMGYVTDSVLGTKAKAPSKYMLEKHYDDTKIMDWADVKKVGLDENGTPKYYNVIYNKEGKAVDVECKVKLEDVSFEPNCKKYSERWWTLKRMKFDLGDKYHPLFKKQNKYDWYGVDYKFSYTYILHRNDFQKLHEEAWVVFVEEFEKALIEQKNELTTDQKRNHNIEIISDMESTEIKEIAAIEPDFVFEYMPIYLYQQTLLYILNEAIDNRRLKISNEYCYDEVVEPLKKLINHFKQVDIKLCDNISFDMVKSTCLDNLNSLYTFFKVISYRALDYGLVDKRYVGMYLRLMDGFDIKPIESLIKHKSLEEQLAQYSVYNHNSIFAELNKQIDDTKEIYQKYNLFYI